MASKLAMVLLWANPLVILFFAEVGSGMKIRFSFNPRTTDSYTPRFTIPAEGGVVHIKNPYGSSDTVELHNRYAMNLDGGIRARKPRNSETADSGTTRGVETDSSSQTKNRTWNVNIPDIMKEPRSNNSTQSHGRDNINSTVSNLGDKNRKSNQVVNKGLVGAQTEKNVEKNTKKDMEANLAVPAKKSDDENGVSRGTGIGNITEVPEDGSAAITAQEEVTSIYLGHSNYTFVAAIHPGVNNVTFDNVKCSGGILNETVVVTSCSCLYGDSWPSHPMARQHVISVGHVKYGKINEASLYRVMTIIYHPSCMKRDDEIWLGDIAMVVVSKPITFNDRVQPMNLPKLTMWDASDILANMSAERRRCRIIGWSARAPMVDTAIGELIPLDECANPVCKAKFPCPRRSTVHGFMVEITPNEPYLLPGSLLFCSNHVFAVVNTKRQCKSNNAFAACSPEELLFARFSFKLGKVAHNELLEYHGLFRENTDGWETYKYTQPNTSSIMTTSAISPPERVAEFASSASILFPFYVYREASWIFMSILSTGYYISFV